MPELQVMVAKARAGAHGGHPRHLAFLVLGMAGLALTGSANGGAGSPGGWRWSPAHNGLRLRVETIRDTVLEGQELPLRLRFQVDPPSRPDSVMRLNGDARAWRWEFRWTHGSDGATFTSGFSGEVRPGDPCRRETCLQPIDRLEDMSIPIQLRAQDCRVFPPGPYRLDVHYVNSGQLTSEFDRSRWKAHPGAWSGRLAAPPVWFTIQADTALTTRFVLPGSLCILADQGNYYCVWGRQDSLVLQLPHRPGGHYVMHRRLGLRGADAASGEYLQGLSGGGWQMVLRSVMGLLPAETANAVRNGAVAEARIEIRETFGCSEFPEQLAWKGVIATQPGPAAFCPADSTGHPSY